LEAVESLLRWWQCEVQGAVHLGARALRRPGVVAENEAVELVEAASDRPKL
jgi:hypothetical protein